MRESRRALGWVVFFAGAALALWAVPPWLWLAFVGLLTMWAGVLLLRGW